MRNDRTNLAIGGGLVVCSPNDVDRIPDRVSDIGVV